MKDCPFKIGFAELAYRCEIVFELWEDIDRSGGC
jgi:hypothetical protein